MEMGKRFILGILLVAGVQLNGQEPAVHIKNYIIEQLNKLGYQGVYQFETSFELYKPFNDGADQFKKEWKLCGADKNVGGMPYFTLMKIKVGDQLKNSALIMVCNRTEGSGWAYGFSMIPFTDEDLLNNETALASGEFNGIVQRGNTYEPSIGCSQCLIKTDGKQNKATL